MDYIKIGRALDHMSRNKYNEYCPDEIINEIFNYTGDIKEMDSNIVKFRFTLNVKYNREDFIDNAYTYTIYYCECCREEYQRDTIRQHFRTKKHKNNMNKNRKNIKKVYNRIINSYVKDIKKEYYTKDVELISVSYTDIFLK